VVERGVVGVCRGPWTILRRHSFTAFGCYSLLCEDVVTCVPRLCRVDEVAEMCLPLKKRPRKRIGVK